MSDKITIDRGNTPAKSIAFEALEKLGRLAVKMQEEDARIQRMAQHIMYPDTALKVIQKQSAMQLLTIFLNL